MGIRIGLHERHLSEQRFEALLQHIDIKLSASRSFRDQYKPKLVVMGYILDLWNAHN